MKKRPLLDRVAQITKEMNECKHTYTLHRSGRDFFRGIGHKVWCLECGQLLAHETWKPTRPGKKFKAHEWTVKEDAPEGEHWTGRDRPVPDLEIDSVAMLVRLKQLWDARRKRDPRG